MTTKQYDLAVFIGRMQIPHLGHMAVIRRGLEVADNVLVILGSANTPPSP